MIISLQEVLITEIVEHMADECNPTKIFLSEKSFAVDTAMSNIRYILKDRTIKLKIV